jgi:chromosomal replication initiation ATPase DnaA
MKNMRSEYYSKINDRVKKIIKDKIGVDVNINSRERYIVESRTLYFTVIREFAPKQTLQSIGDSVGRNHASVMHGLKLFDIVSMYNKEFPSIKDEIINEMCNG